MGKLLQMMKSQHFLKQHRFTESRNGVPAANSFTVINNETWQEAFFLGIFKRAESDADTEVGTVV